MKKIAILGLGIAMYSVSNTVLSGCSDASLGGHYEARIEAKNSDLGYTCKFNLIHGAELSPKVDFCTMNDGSIVPINYISWSLKPNCSFKITSQFGDGRVNIVANGKFQQSDLACGFGKVKVKDSINDARYTGIFMINSVEKQCDSL